MRRVFEQRNGKILLARHVQRGYRALLAQDRSSRPSFTFVGVNVFLTERFGLKRGAAMYAALKRAGLIKVLGCTKHDGAKRLCRVYRSAFGSLSVGYTRYRKRKPSASTKRHLKRPVAPIIDDAAAIRIRRKAKPEITRGVLPVGLIRKLLKYSGKPVSPMPVHVHVHFDYRKKSTE